jgi:hypothetical protein
LNIQWPDIEVEPILNPKDAVGLSWSDVPKF